MSLSNHAAYIRAGRKMGDMKMLDTMIKDGLWDAFNNYHMGRAARNVAAKWGITREEQDEFAVACAEQGRGRAEAGVSPMRSPRSPSRPARAMSSSIP